MATINSYYPSGVPYDLTAAEARTTDRLHIGNRWIDHKGMNTYDNTARMKPKGRFFWLPLAKYIKHPILPQTKRTVPLVRK